MFASHRQGVRGIACAGLLLLALARGVSAEPEFRGLWVDAFHAGFRSAREVDQLIADARAANFNALLVEVRRRGDALYESRFEPKAFDVTPQTFDPLADLIAKAHDTNAGPRLEIHAWMVTYPIWDRRIEKPGQTNHPYLLHPDWLTRNNEGATWNGASYVFDPGHPDVQRHTFDVAMDIVGRYDVDGLNLDYVRYDGVMWGYNEVAVQRFNERHGRSGKPSPTDPLWMQWRRDQVTALVRKIYLSAAAIKPVVKISADTICFAPGVTSVAGWTNSSAAYTSVLQDWRGWLEEGILDLNIPMAYFDQEGNHGQSWTNWNTFIKDHRYGRHAAIGPGAYLNEVSNTLRQIRFTRERTPRGNAADGVSIYSYAAPTADEAFKAEFFAALSQANIARRIEGHNPAVFGEWVPTPAMTWKSTPTAGHLRGTLATTSDGGHSAATLIRFAGPGTERLLEPDATGFFGLANLLPGEYRLVFAPEGNRPVVTNVVVTSGAVVNLELNLEPVARDTAPYFALQPEDGSGLVGESVSFHPLFAGAPPLSAQWHFRGLPLEGATNAVLQLASIDFPKAGDYSLMLSNAVGVATSRVARLTVTAPEGIYAERSSAGFDSAVVSWRTSAPAEATITFWVSTNEARIVASPWMAATNHTLRLASLTPNTTYHYRVESRAGDRVWSVEDLVFRTAGDLVVDNSAASFSGGWSTGRTADGRFGASYRFAGTMTSAATSRASYTPDLSVPGLYDIDVWHPRGSNRSTNAPFVVTYEGGVLARSVNQTIEGGDWMALAKALPMARGAGGGVSLSNATGEFGKVVIADAVRFAYRREQDLPATNAVPYWWALHFFGGPAAASADSDGDLYSNREEFLIGSDPLDAGSSVSASSRINNEGLLEIEFGGVQLDRVYSLEVASDLDRPAWKPVAVVRHFVVPSGAGVFVMRPVPGETQFYRVVAEIPMPGAEPIPLNAQLR